MNAILPPTVLPRTRPAFLQYDNVDDRREILLMLSKLSPVKRIMFFRWCCLKATLPKSSVRPQVAKVTLELAEKARWDSSADQMLCQEIYRDLWYLSAEYRFEIEWAVRKLEEMVRKG